VPRFERKPDHELDRLDDEALFAYARAAREADDREAAARAIAVLVYGHWPNIERRVRMKVPREHVEDVTAEIVTSAIQSAFDGTSAGEFGGWLATITRRRIADYHRRAGKMPTTVPLVSDPDEAGALDPAAASEEGLVETQDVVERVLAGLSEAHRTVVEFVLFEGRTASQAAQELPGMSEDNVHQIVSRFRRALRRALQDGDTRGG
jgi:RNA polymerase sigma factor (sigma-70 family)